MKSSKKRSRKSKLVPRECLDSDDENIADMQNEIEQTIARMTSNSILKKLSRHTEEPLKFSIKVEVEEVDEPINTQIKQEETERELNITIDSVVSLKGQNTDIKNSNLKALLEKTSSPAAILSKGPEVLQYILKEEMIRNEFYKISKQTTSKADKLIEIHILNFFGRYSTAIELDDKELQLQSVIGKWKSWHKVNPKHRDVPLSYKCYICSEAWWHYYDFCQHFHTHDQAELDIETCGQECSIIAYQNKQLDYDIAIDETCWQCGQDFTVHRVIRKGNRIYRCKGCLEKFISCILLSEHLGNCQYFKRTLDAEGVKTSDVFSCRLCPVKYFSQIELEKHLKTRHSVRSDLPVVLNFKNCSTCNRASIDIQTHECANLLFTKSCMFCKRNFQKASNLQMHQAILKKYHKCTICSKILLAECMELEHLLSHSDTYSMVYKCKLCPIPVYFLSELMMKKHRFACHRRHNIDVNIYFFEMIVIPKTLLKNSPLKTYLPKVKSKSNINDCQETQENINACVALEMGLPDFNDCDNKNDDADDYTKSKKGDTNINTDKAVTKIEAVSMNIDELLTNIDEVSTNIDEVPTDIDEVSINIDKASANIDIESNNIKTLNVKIKKEKSDIEDDFNKEYSTEINIKQEPMDIDFNTNCYNEENFNDMVVKEEVIEHVVEVCDLNSGIKIEVKDESVDEIDIINDDGSENNDTTNDDNNEEDFKLIYTSKCRLRPENAKLVMARKDTIAQLAELRTSTHKSRRIYSCKKCSYKGIHRHYKQHIEGRCQNCFYTCTKCNSNHQSMKNYLSHFEQHNYVLNTCPKCLKQLPVMAKLITHVYQHIKNNFVGVHFIKEKTFNKCYQCRQCRDNVMSNEFFKHWESHIEIKNLGTGSQTTDLLENKPILLEVIGLLQGEALEASKELQQKQCVMCLKNFSRKNDLKRHLIEHLLRDAYVNREKYECLKCQICSIGFNKIDIYKRHMRDHASLPLYKCEICDKTFSDSSNFSKHKKVHNLSVLLCDICKKKFTCKAFLIKHMEMHDKLKPIVCECCRRVFHSPSQYRKHRNGRYRFKCPVCSLTFNALKDKWDHMWLEHKERKYLADCPICKKSFRKYQDVKMHIRTTHDSKYVYKPVYVKINKNEVIVCE